MKFTFRKRVLMGAVVGTLLAVAIVKTLNTPKHANAEFGNPATASDQTAYAFLLGEIDFPTAVQQVREAHSENLNVMMAVEGTEDPDEACRRILSRRISDLSKTLAQSRQQSEKVYRRCRIGIDRLEKANAGKEFKDWEPNDSLLWDQLTNTANDQLEQFPDLKSSE